jgi:NADPH:quinone reductase-like Zn-dependent oxidoreductase
VPLADRTLQTAPEGLPDELLIMMCDIFPTGYHGATKAINAFVKGTLRDGTPLRVNGSGPAEFIHQTVHDAVFVCLGCGPVGLCAILTARSKGVGTIYAVDSVDERLAEVEKMGAIPLKLGQDDIEGTILRATEGRGADAVD